MSNKAKNIIVGAVAIANISTPITSLAFNNIEEINSIDSSNTQNRAIKLSGNMITNTDVNLRTDASWSASVLQVVKKGEPVFVVSTSGDWAKVKHDNQTGYIAVKYLESTTNNKTVSEAVNLRKTASWSGDKLMTIKAGESFNLISTSGDWSKVQINGLTGFIPSKYVKDLNTSSNSSQTQNNNMRTVTEAVNLRKTASWSGEIIHTVKAGEQVNVHSNSGDFSKVTHNSKTGYVPSKYIAGSNNVTTKPNTNTSNSNIEVMNKTGKVVNLKSNDTLNVRSGTSTSTSSIGKLSAGTTVQITGKDKATGWYQINYNGKTGYVGDYYIEIVNTSTTTSVNKKTTTNLNMRSGPGTNYSLIVTIPQNSVVKVISSSNGWDYVEFNGKKGYCSSSYLVKTDEVSTVKKYTTTNLNMRTGPSTSYSIITTIDTNSQVEVISESNGWSKIKFNGKEGYVNSSYLSNSPSSNDLPASNPKYSRVKVVIDPGHGGTDPGAIGFGRNEKDIALSISKKINANLKTLGFQTVMTRSTDVYIPLAQRYQIANNNNADIFVSVHLNSATSSADGIETLYKNTKTLASDIQNQMISATGARNRGLKYRSDLAVLNGTKMPASLVETGFISNSAESAKLATNAYQDTLANSIAKGIAKYTDNNVSK